MHAVTPAGDVLTALKKEKKGKKEKKTHGRQGNLWLP